MLPLSEIYLIWVHQMVWYIAAIRLPLMGISFDFTQITMQFFSAVVLLFCTVLWMIISLFIWWLDDTEYVRFSLGKK